MPQLRPPAWGCKLERCVSCCRPLPAMPVQAQAGDPAPVAEVLSSLAAGMGPDTPLRRLAVHLTSADRSDAYFVLPSGCLVAVQRLLEPASLACAEQQGLRVEEWRGPRGTCVLLTSSVPPAVEPPAAVPSPPARRIDRTRCRLPPGGEAGAGAEAALAVVLTC